MAHKNHYFLGIGQGAWTVQYLTSKFSDITFHKAPEYVRYKKGDDLKKFGCESVAKAVGKQKHTTIFAESQAAPAVIEAIYGEHIELPDRLILIQPLGFNSDAFGSDAASKRSELLRRTKLFWLHSNQSLTIEGNRRTLSTIAAQTARNPLNTKHALVVAASLNSIDLLKTISKNIKVDMFISTEDSLFPPNELKSTIPKTVTTHELPGTHLNRATPNGIAQLQTILSALQ